jgi:hypothetical protein
VEDRERWRRGVVGVIFELRRVEGLYYLAQSSKCCDTNVLFVFEGNTSFSCFVQIYYNSGLVPVFFVFRSLVVFLRVPRNINICPRVFNRAGWHSNSVRVINVLLADHDKLKSANGYYKSIHFETGAPPSGLRPGRKESRE